jgi:hypothetical protein
MKQVLYILIISALFSFSASTLFSQTSKSDKVKERLLELFELSQNDDYASACKYMVYRGEDKQRRWKDWLDENNADEFKDSKQICLRIKSYLMECPEYEFKNFSTETESEGEWCIWQVEFCISGKTKTQYFAFLKIKGKYCLGDID